MSRGVQWSLFGSAVVAALIALAGCSHYLFAEREPWRHDAEVAVSQFRRREGKPGARAHFRDQRSGHLRRRFSAAGVGAG